VACHLARLQLWLVGLLHGCQWQGKQVCHLCNMSFGGLLKPPWSIGPVDHLPYLLQGWRAVQKL